MGLSGTAIIYGIIGVVVAVAMVLREEHPSAARAGFLLAAGILFWPLFAPMLLGGKTEASVPLTASSPGRSDVGRGAARALDLKIRAAEAQLIAALARVQDGAAGGAMAQESARVRELSQGLCAMAARLAEIDEALASPELREDAALAALAELSARGHGADDPRVKSLAARLRSIEMLKVIRGRTHDDLERAIFKMDEITAQMRILRFAERPQAEVAEQLREIEGCVEGVTEAMLAVG
jgi:hypothetical protein